MRRVMQLCAAIVVAATVPAVLGAAPAALADPVPHPHRAPWPVTVTVQTVPPLPGVQFSFDRTILTTDGAGRASYTGEHNFADHSLGLLTTALDLPDRRYRFARWAGQRDPEQAFVPSLRGLPMRANYTVTAAFTAQYPVRAAFVDQDGQPLDLGQISAVKVRGDAGEILDFPTGEAIWLTGAVPTYRDSELVESIVSYSLQSITMNGTNIVDSGRQRFTPAEAATVTFTGQLHDLTVGATDAVFRDSVGSSAVVTYPDGTMRTVPFGPDHKATLTNLPRGTYRVSVGGASGIVLEEQVGLSRDKVLTVGVLTTGNLATLVTAGLVLAAVLLLIGRLRRHVARVLATGVRWLRGTIRREVATG